MSDFVVAIENQTKRIVRSWKGENFRNFNSEKISQYKISMAKDAAEAEQRALEIHTQLGR